MPTSLDHLLPAADERVRCADHARSIAIDPGGTALRADRIVLVEAPLPWPKPALDHPLVAPLARALAGSPVPTRLLVTVPTGEGEGGAPEDSLTVTVFERRGASAVERRYRAGSPEAVAELVEALGANDPARAAAHLEAEHDPARPTLLVCTQGSHDVCCGADGTRMALEAEAALTGPGGPLHRVHRVSHTGGHRFAPTAMTLPGGRMWAFLDLDLLTGILASTAEPAQAAARCRGWWGASEGPGQMAERAVLAELGWALDGCDRRVELAEPGDGGAVTATVTVEAPSGPPQRWRVEVEPGRDVPTIACRAPGGLPAKPGREYRIAGVSRLD